MIKTEAMENNENLIESLIERAAEYSKTSFELVKLKALDKSADVVSTCITHSVVIAFFLSFMFFLNFGLALWLGEILGKTFYGFLIVAAFYGITGIFIQVECQALYGEETQCSFSYRHSPIWGYPLYLLRCSR